MRAPQSIEVPYTSQLTENSNLVSRAWAKFFESVQTALDALGTEKYFELVNNTAIAADIDGLSFDKQTCSWAAVDYLIQRVTTGGGAVENIEAGTFYLAYRPTSVDWVLSSGPSAAGVSLTITTGGQVQYTTTNVGGTASISKLTWRARTLAAKNSLYSKVGR